ncbi:IS110 family transposase [Sphaerisporangium sp. NBC_01403]|uniref:IS110 family transposase n=1 Tax=Sphaerisporangium sp. NBC_01403 TaxID=2903599 RepID=UPI003254405E
MARFSIKHSAEGIAQLIRRLAKYGDPELVPIVIEGSNGRLVDLLLEARHAVVPASPNAIKTWRGRAGTVGRQVRCRDAAVIAEYLRLRHHRLQVVTPYSSQTKAVRTVVVASPKAG